jgi:hypothetical protein
MKDNLFCPLIKQECKKDECVMWKHDTCLISVYLLSNIVSVAYHNMDSNNGISDTNSELVEELFSGFAVALDNSGEQNAPNEKLDSIFSKSADALADEILQFAKNEKLLDDEESYLSHEIEELFWSNKGLELDNKELPKKYRSIKKKAWLIASTKIKKENKPSHFNWLNRESTADENIVSSLSNELLAEQLLTFAKESNLGQDDFEVLSRSTLELFWKSKGIQNTFGVSAEIGIKIKQVEKLTRDKLNEKVFAASNEDLSRELATYAKKKAGRENGQGVYVQSAAHTFWRNKGLGYRTESLELDQRKDEIERLAQELIDKDFHEYRDKRLEAEKNELPKLIQDCADWARSTGRYNVTIKDVKYFLLEKKIDILEATERALYLSTNNELKTRKKAF